MLDPHIYMRYNDPSRQPSTGSVIGNTSDPDAASTLQFRLFRNELAGRFVDNEKVIFGIMDEVCSSGTLLGGRCFRFGEIAAYRATSSLTTCLLAWFFELIRLPSSAFAAPVLNNDHCNRYVQATARGSVAYLWLCT